MTRIQWFFSDDMGGGVITHTPRPGTVQEGRTVIEQAFADGFNGYALVWEKRGRRWGVAFDSRHGY
jgi:hypothetical protein